MNGYTAHFQCEMRIVDSLDGNIPIGADDPHSEGQILDLSKDMAVLTYSISLKVNEDVVARGETVKRHIITKAETTVSPYLRRFAPFVRAKRKALDLLNRTLLYEPSKEATTMFTHLVNAKRDFITLEHSTSDYVVLPKHTRLGSIVDTEINRFFATVDTMQISQQLGKRSRGNISY